MKKRQLTVLIAVHGPEDRATLRGAILRDPSARYAVIEAVDGAHALELCRERSPDCLILNHDLPDLSVLEALKRLGGADRTPACGVVVLVGAGDTRLAVEAMKSGAHDCLEENRARGAELLRAVNNAIEKVEQRRSVAHERAMVDE